MRFTVHLEHAILYPESINTKTSTANCMRWKQNHLNCVAMSTSHTNHCCFVRDSNKVKGFFLLPVSRCSISRRQAHVRGVTLWQTATWIMNVELGVWYIIGEIPAWPRKSGNYGKKLLPTCIKNWASNFCALFVKLNVNNQYIYPTHPTRKALKKPCGRSAIFQLHYK